MDVKTLPSFVLREVNFKPFSVFPVQLPEQVYNVDHTFEIF